MPLQGHWERVNTPVRRLGRRERRVVLAVAAVLVGAAIAAIIVAIGSSSPAVPAGCIRVEVPSTTGGGVTQFCDEAAARFCAGPAAHSASLESTALPKCREAGYR